MPLILSRFTRHLWAAAILGAVLPWLASASGHAGPHRLVQSVVAASLAVLLVLVGRASRSAIRTELERDRLTGWCLLGLLLISVLVHFAGLSFEVGHGYYRDEGIYRATAERINAGNLLPQSFIYGHLSFYLPAWSLWLHQLFPAATTWLVSVMTGLTDEGSISWMWIRVWSGLFGALTVLPVYGAARRVIGEHGERIGSLAGFLAGGLIAASTLYNEVTHVYISDVPAAFFAAVCVYFVARLLERETPRDYVWAGVASGFAAGSKYPAGLVALAIAAVWASWCWRERRVSKGLLLAAGASLATFLIVMPAFLLHAPSAFAGEGRDVFFGVRQYVDSGWIGVEKDSNVAWYGSQLLETLGAGALVIGTLGFFGLDREMRRRWAVMAVFPLVYGALLVVMSMVVKRNLLPLLPAAAVLLGAGCAGASRGVVSRFPRLRWLAPGAVILASLAAPAIAVVQQDLGLTLPGTRELATAWIREHVPPGAGIVKESYTPRIDGPYDVLQTRFAARVEPADLWSGRYDLVLLADTAYSRFLDPDNLRKEHQKIYAERYRELLAMPELQAFEPGRTRRGPGFSLRALERASSPPRNARDFTAAEAAYLSDETMRPRGEAPIVFTGAEQFALFKENFAAGRYTATVDGDALGGGTLQAVGLDGTVFAEATLPPAGACELELKGPGKLFFYLKLLPGATLRGLHLHPSS
ncbi:MAG: glycosyltransferase family 39 protein [Acidobacteriota bacterium]